MATKMVRRAKIGDEEQIAKVHIQSWQEAYRGLIPQSYLDALPNELSSRIENWKRALTNAERWIWVAETSGQIVGFSLFGPPREAHREGYIELGAIYLLAEHTGVGTGFALLSMGFEFMRTLGYRKAYCWVLDQNPTARFYERTGAAFLGETKIDQIAGQDFKELVYEWKSI